MIRDERERAAAREDNKGATMQIQRGRLNPYRQLFGQVTSRTRHPRLYDQPNSSLTNTEEPPSSLANMTEPSYPSRRLHPVGEARCRS
jgi:hypothetical protein